VNWAELVDSDSSDSQHSSSEDEGKKEEDPKEKHIEEPLISMESIYEKGKDGEFVIKGLKVVNKKEHTKDHEEEPAKDTKVENKEETKEIKPLPKKKPTKEEIADKKKKEMEMLDNMISTLGMQYY